MFRSYRISNYTGLACTFSFLIREHGVQTVYDAVLSLSKSLSSGSDEDRELSDALGKLAIAINSKGIKSLVEGIPSVKKAWRKKTEARVGAWHKLLETADQINYRNLAFFKFMEVPQLPFNLPARTRFIIPEPVSRIDVRLEKFAQDRDEHSWYPFEKFILSEYPALIQSQIELYDQLVEILQTGRNDTNNHALSILEVPKGSIHKVADLGQHYDLARDTLPRLRAEIEKFEGALKEELNGSRFWDEARSEIEKELPDQLGHIIVYETIKGIESKIEGAVKEGLLSPPAY
jgi:hypothetical protein